MRDPIPVRLKSMLAPHRQMPFHRMINIWDIRDSVIIGMDGRISAGFEITAPDMSFMEKQETEAKTMCFRRLLNGLPSESVLQWIIRAREGNPEILEQYRNCVSGTIHNAGKAESFAQKIVQAKYDWYKSKPVQKRRCFLFAGKKPKSRIKPGIFPVRSREFGGIAQSGHIETMKELSLLIQSVLEQLSSAGITVRQLDNRELFDFCFSHLNPLFSRRTKPVYEHPFLTLRSRLAWNAFANEFAHGFIDGYYCKGLHLETYPDYTDTTLFPSLLEKLWPDYDICFSIESADTKTKLESLKRKANFLRNMISVSSGKNYGTQQKYTEIDELLSEMAETSQKLFDFRLNLLVRSRDKHELDEKTGLALSSFENFASARAVSSDMCHDRMFLACLPGHSHLNHRHFLMPTNGLANLLPLSWPWQGCSAPKMLFETSHAELLPVDPFDESLPAKHGIIIGATGSGKSFMANYMLANFFLESESNHIVIIDVGGSYRKFAKLFSGQYLDVDMSGKYLFTPFPLKCDLGDDEEAALVSILAKMCMYPDRKNLSASENRALRGAVRTAYDNIGEKGRPRLSDLVGILKNCTSTLLAIEEELVPACKRLAAPLQMWCEGSYGRILDAKESSVNVDNRLTVFDLQKLESEKELQAITFFAIRSLIYEKLRDVNLRKIIAIDEGWKFFDDETGSRLIQDLYRTARKYNAMILSISQSPVEFLKSKAGTAIVSNSYVKYILQMKKDLNLLENLGLNTRETEAVKSIQTVPGRHSEIFLKFGNCASILKIEPCPMDYWICTSSPQDRKIENEIRQRNPHACDMEILEMLCKTRQG